MIYIDTNRWMLERATARMKMKVPGVNYAAHREADDERKFLAFLAEEAVSYLYPWLTRTDGVNADFRRGRLMLDVKNKHFSRRAPVTGDVGNICAEQKKFDLYLHTRTHLDKSGVWLCGFHWKELLHENPPHVTLKRAGEVNQNYEYSYDEWELTYGSMWEPESGMQWLYREG